MVIGKVVNNATLIDSFLFTAFMILSGCSGITASAIFHTFDTLQGKKSLLMRLVDVAGDDQDKKLVKAIIQAAEKANTQRQEVSHALLVVKNQQPGSTPLIVRAKSRHARPLTKDWLAHLICHSHDAAMDDQQAFQSLCKKHQVPAIPQL